MRTQGTFSVQGCWAGSMGYVFVCVSDHLEYELFSKNEMQL